MIRHSAILVCSLLLTAAASAAEPTFAIKPDVNRAGDGAMVTFTASTATDVEVAILNRDGKVIRHLAAGRLGDNAPAPLVKDSLKQTLRWDGKDDLGQRAEGGPFRVRVRLGLQPELDGFLGDNPAALALEHGSEANAPLARAILGGLLAGVPATLFALPALYSLLVRETKKSESAEPVAAN